MNKLMCWISMNKVHIICIVLEVIEEVEMKVIEVEET